MQSMKKQDPRARRTAPMPHKCYKCCKKATNIQPQSLINLTNAVNTTRIPPQSPINTTCHATPIQVVANLPAKRRLKYKKD